MLARITCSSLDPSFFGLFSFESARRSTTTNLQEIEYAPDDFSKRAARQSRLKRIRCPEVWPRKMLPLRLIDSNEPLVSPMLASERVQETFLERKSRSPRLFRVGNWTLVDVYHRFHIGNRIVALIHDAFEEASNCG